MSQTDNFFHKAWKIKTIDPASLELLIHVHGTMRNDAEYCRSTAARECALTRFSPGSVDVPCRRAALPVLAGSLRQDGPCSWWASLALNQHPSLCGEEAPVFLESRRATLAFRENLPFLEEDTISNSIASIPDNAELVAASCRRPCRDTPPGSIKNHPQRPK